MKLQLGFCWPLVRPLFARDGPVVVVYGQLLVAVVSDACAIGIGLRLPVYATLFVRPWASMSQL